MVLNLKQRTLFNIINILGNHKNFKLHKNKYKIQLLFNTIHNSILILRIKDYPLLAKFKYFNLFFINYIKEYHLGIKQNFKFFNSLKNNFKLFIYLLHGSSLLSFNTSIKGAHSSFSLVSLNILNNYNNYYTYNYLSNKDLSKVSSYNFLYKDIFKDFSLNMVNKFRNYTYLRSNKKKRFKQKESEKLTVLRENLNMISNTPYRLKFYYRYFEYKRLHSYWNKEAFLNKKFKYFNPSSSSSSNPKNTKDLYLLHFFYKFRKSRKLTNNYLLFKKKIFINFWLQTKIKRFSLFSYKPKFIKKKTRLKFFKVYKNIGYSFLKELLDSKRSVLLNKYNNYIFNLKKKKTLYFLLFCKNNNLFYSSNVANTFILDSNKSKKQKLLNSLVYYKRNKNISSNSFEHIFNSSRRVKNFKKFCLPSSLFWKRKRNGQLFALNTNNLTKSFFFNHFKKNKSFRIKFKYIQWLNNQKVFKSWKFNKYLSNKKAYTKRIKGNLNNSSSIQFKRRKNGDANINSIICGASTKMNNWSNTNKTMYHLKNSKFFNPVFDSLVFSTNKYLKNFSFYKSNKVLNAEYAYWNMFKERTFNFNKIKLKRRVNRKNRVITLNKISKSLFKRSWSIISKNKNLSKFKGYYNYVPISNYFFLKKVISLYKKLFISKVLFTDLIFKKSNKRSKKKLLLSYNNFEGNPNILNRIQNIRLIDKKYGFKKRKERNLFKQLKKYKNIKKILLNKLSKLDKDSLNKKFNIKSNNLNLLQYKIQFNLVNIKKIILKLKSSLKKISSSNLKKNIFLNSSSIKMSNYRDISFINFLSHSFRTPVKPKFSDLFLNSINSNTNNRLLSLVGLKSSFKNFKIRRSNSNKLRLVRFKNNKHKLSNLFSGLKKNKVLLNSLVLTKFKKNYFSNYNWGLNSVLRKNYSIFLKLFKYFSFYKVIDKDAYFLGLGKLSNHLSINNENIFSSCNFFMYNFVNYSTWDVNNFDNKNNDYVGISEHISSINQIKLNDISDKSSEQSVLLEAPSSMITRDSNSISEYDVLNKVPNLFSNISNSRHFIIKYNSLLLLTPLLSVYNNNVFKKKISKVFDITPLNKQLKLNRFNTSILHWYLLMDSSLLESQDSLSKLYSGLLHRYNKI